MPAAQSLADLLRIREANRDTIDRVNGNLGSALGFKRTTGAFAPDTSQPAILIFVPRKVDATWLPLDQQIPKTFSGPNGLTCPVDVVEGKFPDEEPLLSADFNSIPPSTVLTDPILWDHVAIVQSGRLQPSAPLSDAQLKLREELRGWSAVITPGAQLAGFKTDGRGYFGTLGCFARRQSTGRLGFITNHHVADHMNNVLFHPDHNLRRVGTVQRMFEFVTDEARFSGLIDEPGARYRVDCAFVRLHDEVSQADIDPRLPILDSTDNIRRVTLGAPLPLDLNTMEPLGRKVIGVGRTRSFQRGQIVAFGYEHRDEDGESIYTDYLILGEDTDRFSAGGDSGKLIFTDEATPRPVALLWGGREQQLRTGREIEKWTYAIDINHVLTLLDADIVTTL